MNKLIANKIVIWQPKKYNENSLTIQLTTIKKIKIEFIIQQNFKNFEFLFKKI